MDCLTKPIGSWYDPSDLTDGFIPVSDGTTLEDSNIYQDNTGKIGVGISSDLCCDFNVDGTSHFQTGSLLSTDGIIARPSPLSFTAVGAPVPQITGEINGGVPPFGSRAFSVAPGLFITEDNNDFLFSNPTLFFSDNVGTANTAMQLSHDPAIIATRIENASVVHFAENLTRKTLVGMGNWGTGSTVAAPTSWLHVRDVATGTDHLLHLESGTSGDVTQLFSRGSAQYAMGIDDTDSQKFKLSYNSSLGTNDRVVVDILGNMGLGLSNPDTRLDIAGALTIRELSSDPSDPDEGSFVFWMSDGTGSGDDGDVMIKITAAGSTKTITWIDFSAS